MPVNEMQVPDGLMNFLIVVAVIYAIQTSISLAWLVLEIVRDDHDHQNDSKPEDYSC